MVPVYRSILADLETPVSAYLKVASGPGSFLLESVEGGERLARYSFLGTDPYLVAELDRGQTRFVGGGVERRESFQNPLDVLRRELGRFQPVFVPGLPSFVGGAVGYLAYECARYFERLPAPEGPGLGVPEAIFLFVDTVLVFDHLRHRILVVSNVHLDEAGDADRGQAYDQAVERIDRLVKRLRRPLPDPAERTPCRAPRRSPLGHALGNGLYGNIPPGRYQEMVVEAKKHINAGDIIQVVPSQRFSRATDAHPFSIYRALRTINPSPYMYYLDLGGFQIVGASPELLVRVEDGQVTSHPIAGTRRRGKTSDEDLALETELAGDEKEQAEHIMLVDLGRNDVGKVSQPGTVRVPKLMQVERYSHVMHLVSHVTGQLRPGLTGFDAFESCFPAGTVSGAPKIRAMEIIAGLEHDRRGTYAGAVGYFGYNGNLDTAIAIRTCVYQDGIVSVQAGGGIVADSEPEFENEETHNKARAVLSAIDVAERELSPVGVR
ncbi:MAG TPA: anthranilate synthase component I [Chloroflexota bacterium]|nr:anthranilate synthase component I [Chloroflexota bacterium]